MVKPLKIGPVLEILIYIGLIPIIFFFSIFFLDKTIRNPVNDDWKTQFDTLHYMIPLIWLPTSALFFQILVHRSSKEIIRGRIAGIIFGIVMVIFGTWSFFASDFILYGASCCNGYVILPTAFWTFSMVIIQIGILSIFSKINLWSLKKNKVKPPTQTNIPSS